MLALIPNLISFSIPFHVLAAQPRPSTEEETSNGKHPTIADPNTETVRQIGRPHQKLVDAVSDDDDDSTSTIHNLAFATEAEVSDDFRTALGTARSTARATGTITAPVLADANGCLSAQRLFSSCANAWTSTTACGSFINNNVHNPETRGTFATQAEGRSVLSLLHGKHNMTTQVFDGHISRCDAYLQTASLPATTTASVGVAAVIASAAQAKIDSNVGFYFKAGDVRKPADLVSTTNSPTAGGTSSSSVPTNRAMSGNRFTPKACSLMLTGLVTAVTLIIK
ncbi:MAG: hypothetical protein Q9200_005389 [Gallowayella weberi]